MPEQTQYKDILTDYNYRWTEGQNKFQGKYDEIRESRIIMKNLLPNTWFSDTVFTQEVGNDPDGSVLATRSQAIHPISSAIGEKLRTDLKASDATFEIVGNDLKGSETAEAMEQVMRDTYTLTNTRKRYMHGLDHLVFSGTMITQPVCEELKEKTFGKNGEEVEVNLGRSLTFKVYDPLTSMIDWNADPMDVQETAQWGIVTIGNFSKDTIEAKWGVKLKGYDHIDEQGNISGSYIMVDQYKIELQKEAGLVLSTGLTVREYYLNNGKKYVVLQDSYILDESIVVGAVDGSLPLMVTPFMSDPDSVYGVTLARFIEVPLQIASTILNQVGDLNAWKTNMPLVTFKGMIDGGALGMSLDMMQPGTIMELSVPSDARFGESGVNMDMDVNKAMGRPPIEEIGQGADWLFSKAMESIWYLTGLNPTSLGGFQDKQIRVSDVADIINQSSLRNSSALVMNLEANFFNPTTRAFIRFMGIYYDEFPELEKSGVQQESLADMRSIRIVNGSYLPADKLQEQQINEYMYQLFMGNPTAMDGNKIMTKLIESMGRVPERYMRDPLQVMLQEQAVDLQQFIQQVGDQEFINMIANNAAAQQGEQGGA
jgi:hypothetical protein